MRRLAWVWGPALAQMAAIFFLSHQPTLPSLPGGLTSYTGHLIAYFVLAVFAVRACVGADWRQLSSRAGWIAWWWSVLYGVSDEIHQAFVPGRTATWDDVLADAIGAAAGVAAVFLWRGARRRRADARL